MENSPKTSGVGVRGKQADKRGKLPQAIQSPHSLPAKPGAFCFRRFAGADPDFRYPIRFINELAWQKYFCSTAFFIKMKPGEQTDLKPYLTLIAVPTFQADPGWIIPIPKLFIIINFSRRLIIIGGSHYAGEIKKLVFSTLNYLLPQRNVLPMHCSANIWGREGDVRSLFRPFRNRQDLPLRRSRTFFNRR